MKQKSEIPFPLFLDYHRRRLGLTIERFAKRFAFSKASYDKWAREKRPARPKSQTEAWLRLEIASAEPARKDGAK